MSGDPRRRLLSPAAERMLKLLTPERVPLSYSQAHGPAMSELVRLDLVDREWCTDGWAVRLSQAGISNRPDMRQ